MSLPRQHSGEIQEELAVRGGDLADKPSELGKESVLRILTLAGSIALRRRWRRRNLHVQDVIEPHAESGGNPFQVRDGGYGVTMLDS
jgi:hypothetical protein